jgi:hypothetical protein
VYRSHSVVALAQDRWLPCPGQAFFFDAATGQFTAMGTTDFDFAAFIGYPYTPALMARRCGAHAKNGPIPSSGNINHTRHQATASSSVLP